MYTRAYIGNPAASSFDWWRLFDSRNYSNYSSGNNRRNNVFSYFPRNHFRRRAPAELITEEVRARHNDADKPKPKIEGILKAESVDLNRNENRAAHNTSKYMHKNLIVRRGQSFKIDVTFNRKYNPEKDKISLKFVTGPRPKPTKGTLVRVQTTDDLPDGDWGIKIFSTDGKVVKLEVMTPNICIVAPWSIYVVTKFEDKSDEMNIYRFKVEDDIYVLFNPWNKDDQVYMEGDDEKDEYVLNDTGRIWKGAKKGRYYSMPWNFGQFEEVCLNAAMHLLEISDLNDHSQGNATLVVRVLSALVNSNDNDGGILTGNWSGKYDAGTAPYKWVGSVKIMKQYMERKSAVKFGQCWVFSGVMTTVCRALGIPTRSVTNFKSAHDTDGSMSIDYHWDKFSGDAVEFLNDSIWNYHVWNESWFRRPDLPPGYDGWQAHDATPQELSEGVMQCGPAPLTAIKQGDVYVGYDTKFIFAEVNGDKVHWFVDVYDDYSLEVRRISHRAVGRSVSTKAVGSNSRQDITSEYKFPDGSEEEQATLGRAYQHSSKQKLLAVPEGEKNDVLFELEDDEAANGDMTFSLKMENISTDKRTVNITMSVAATYYTGLPGERIKQLKDTVSVNSYEVKHLKMELPVLEYMNKLNDDAEMKVFCCAKVEETGYVFVEDEVYDIDKEDLTVEASQQTPKVGDEFDVKISFKNKLSIPLHGGVIEVESPGIIRDDLIINIDSPVEPGALLVKNVTLKPMYDGKREIICSFNSNELKNITGSVGVVVLKKE
ncbi:protein-glutamine gamma-glutamyltransferase 4-like [Tubulanus polymorphus]|uniref:protein-glutamine gamma-glutamyltransferase 4-like n=1 Tax=Tubulanus polymorphus TaxID=672921 RepID=UPI003DA444F8